MAYLLMKERIETAARERLAHEASQQVQPRSVTRAWFDAACAAGAALVAWGATLPGRRASRG